MSKYNDGFPRLRNSRGEPCSVHRQTPLGSTGNGAISLLPIKHIHMHTNTHTHTHIHTYTHACKNIYARTHTHTHTHTHTWKHTCTHALSYEFARGCDHVPIKHICLHVIHARIRAVISIHTATLAPKQPKIQPKKYTKPQLAEFSSTHSAVRDCQNPFAHRQARHRQVVRRYRRHLPGLGVD